MSFSSIWFFPKMMTSSWVIPNSSAKLDDFFYLLRVRFKIANIWWKWSSIYSSHPVKNSNQNRPLPEDTVVRPDRKWKKFRTGSQKIYFVAPPTPVEEYFKDTVSLTRILNWSKLKSFLKTYYLVAKIKLASGSFFETNYFGPTFCSDKS